MLLYELAAENYMGYPEGIGGRGVLDTMERQSVFDEAAGQ